MKNCSDLITWSSEEEFCCNGNYFISRLTEISWFFQHEISENLQIGHILIPISCVASHDTCAVFNFSAPATPASNVPAFQCGCVTAAVVASSIRDDTGTAICTQAGKSNGKGSQWTLTCATSGQCEYDSCWMTHDSYFLATSLSMGKGCRLNGALACSKPGSTNNNNSNDNGGFPVQPAGDPRPQCSTLSSAQSANPSASFSCVAASGKQETLSCTVNGVTNTFTGKKKKVISWATSSSCSASSGGSSSGGSTSGGSASCNCQAEVANFLNIRVSRILWLSGIRSWKVKYTILLKYTIMYMTRAESIRSWLKL